MIFSIRLHLFQNRLTKKFAVPREKNYAQIFNQNPVSHIADEMEFGAWYFKVAIHHANWIKHQSSY